MTPFRLIQTTPTTSGFRAVMATDMDSIIYKAHFPSSPITPGACLIQAARDLVENHLGRKVVMREVKSVKFLSVIIPDGMGDIIFDIQCPGDANLLQASVAVKVTVSKSDAVCARMSFVFQTIPLTV